MPLQTSTKSLNLLVPKYAFSLAILFLKRFWKNTISFNLSLIRLQHYYRHILYVRSPYAGSMFMWMLSLCNWILFFLAFTKKKGKDIFLYLVEREVKYMKCCLFSEAKEQKEKIKQIKANGHLLIKTTVMELHMDWVL